MHLADAYSWLQHGERRQRIVIRLTQPMTARQLSRRVHMTLNDCSHVLWELCVYALVLCLNQWARRGRLFWLTELGQSCQRQLRDERGLRPITYDFPVVDWDLYGWVCYSHRSAVVRALAEPMQPARIKRVACSRDPRLKMSANNVRDVIRLMTARGVVEPVQVRKRAHPCYQLTEVGTKIRELLQRTDQLE